MADLDDLRSRWLRTLLAARDDDSRAPSPEPPPEQYGDALLRRWSEPQRHYHTVEHLAAVLGHIDVLEEYADDAVAVRLAAWFHDAVYLPDRSENEERSARLAERALPEAGVPAERTAEVARLVRLTTGHDPAPDDRDGQVLCDADLAILAAPPSAYAAYTAAVRAEYHFVPSDAFREGRSAILRQLLALPSLFHTPHGREKWEATARYNLTAELEMLSP
jgi:predicted metal-dependent HD superfamily phosphohydrolase